MICPTCNTGIRFEVAGSSQVYESPDFVEQRGFDIAHGFCPECNQLIVLLREGRYWQADLNEPGSRELVSIYSKTIIYPRAAPRKVPEEVPEEYREEFSEANAVLAISPKASAAISRRLLQRTLRDELHVQARSLAEQIDLFLAQPGVPSHLGDAVDAVRQIGNLAAHPIKDERTGEIVPVEPGEAEWLLDVLDALFDYVFVQPLRLKQRREALNQKLAAAGKPALKPEPSAVG